jgi:hypothetical protein
MKTVRSSIVLFFIFLVTTSILLNYSDHSYKNVLDIFEEITAINRAEAKEYSLFKGIIKNEITFISLSQTTNKKTRKQIPLQKFNFNCKIKSYLHLLQLF